MRGFWSILLGLFLNFYGLGQVKPQPRKSLFNDLFTPPPPTPKRPVRDVYFGQTVVDNYRWLEDMKSPQTQAWFRAQADYTNRLLDQISGRDSLLNSMLSYDALKPATISQVKKRGNRYFYRKTLASENVGKIYYREAKSESRELGVEKLLYDPATYGIDKVYSVSGFTPSDDGQWIVIGVTQSGAELSTLQILKVATQTPYPELIQRVWGGEVNWAPDNQGFFYTVTNSADTKNSNYMQRMRCLYHRVGRNPKEDTLRFSASYDSTFALRSEEIPIVFCSVDAQYIFAQADLSGADPRLRLFVAPVGELTKPHIHWQSLLSRQDSVLNTSRAGKYQFFHSLKGTSKGCILRSDAANPDLKKAIVILPEGPWNISAISASKDYLFVVLNDGINDHLKQYDIQTTQWADINLPQTGELRFWPLDPARGDECLLQISSWKEPPTLYHYDPLSATATISPFHAPINYPGLDNLLVEELEVPSHDGVLIPLSLIYRKDLQRDGKAICFLTGYGAYGLATTPFFSQRYLALLNQGVIVAETHVRGGGEKGGAWHKAGFKTTKSNGWKDFIASGEYLIKQGYTSPSHLIGEGTSAGGILIGRAITDRPDLFAAAISNVGTTDMLRGELMPDGPLNVPEFGSIQDSLEYRALYEMDAQHQIKAGVRYPAVIGVGGMNDPRVMAWQPGKFVGALQNATSSGRPALLHVDFDGGHFNEDKKVRFRKFANMYAFALWQAGHSAFQPAKLLSKRPALSPVKSPQKK